MSQETLRTIVLDGPLAKQFGKVHSLVINSPAEAVRALCNTIEGFHKAVMDYEPGFHVFVNDDDIEVGELHNPTGLSEIRITPVVTAAGGGFFKIIVGAALIGAAFLTGGASIAAWGMTSMVMGGLGAAMLFGGVAQLFSPKQQGLSGVDSVDNGASYHFNGPVNTTAQGNCIPLLYGEMWVGSVTASAGIYNEDIEA